MLLLVPSGLVFSLPRMIEIPSMMMMIPKLLLRLPTLKIRLPVMTSLLCSTRQNPGSYQQVMEQRQALQVLHG